MYVPLPVGAPVGSNVCQVPPPAKATPLNRVEDPRETKVPDPVRLIDEPSCANAESVPPALIVGGLVLKLTLIMSQRICWPAIAAVAPAPRSVAAATPVNNQRTRLDPYA